jgi:hypothetical protein
VAGTPRRGRVKLAGPSAQAGAAPASSCRHAIPKGAPLKAEQRAYVVDVICRWVERQVPD